MKIRVFGTMRHLLGSADAEVDTVPGGNVRDILMALAADHPRLGQRILDEDGELQRSTNVLVNGRHISHLDGLATEVTEGDRIALFPAVGGG